jgi:6-phosphogluconolactonase (cycloisomerase 2 family)
VTNAGSVTLTGFNLLRDAEVVGPGVGSHLCVSGTNSNNVGCFAINNVTRLPGTTAVNTVAVTNVRGLRIAPNGCGTAGVGSALTVQGIKVDGTGTVTLTNTAAPTTNPRYGAMSADGTLAAWGGFGTQFSLFSVNTTTCNITLVTSNNNGITTSLVEYMAFDDLNRLYVADSLANQIRVFQATTSSLTLLGSALTNHGTINAPAGIDAALLSAVPVELQRFGIE